MFVFAKGGEIHDHLWQYLLLKMDSDLLYAWKFPYSSHPVYFTEGLNLFLLQIKCGV